VLVWSKTWLMSVTKPGFRLDVNVSIATTGNGRFSAVDHWPVLSVHRGAIQTDLTLNAAAGSTRRCSAHVFVFTRALVAPLSRLPG
jgi:hypothetical protein